MFLCKVCIDILGQPDLRIFLYYLFTKYVCVTVCITQVEQSRIPIFFSNFYYYARFSRRMHFHLYSGCKPLCIYTFFLFDFQFFLVFILSVILPSGVPSNPLGCSMWWYLWCICFLILFSQV